MRNQMQQLLRNFERFQDEWKEHRLTTREGMNQLSNVHTHVQTVKEHIEHLDQLPVIAEALTNIQDRLLRFITAFLLILAGIVIIILTKDSNTSIKTPIGFEINHPEEKK